MNDKVSLEEYLELLNKYEELRGNLIHRNNEYYVLKDDHNQLQSNWNSLREWLKEYSHDLEFRCYMDMVLDKMNELEGVENESNRYTKR